MQSAQTIATEDSSLERVATDWSEFNLRRVPGKKSKLRNWGRRERIQAMQDGADAAVETHNGP